ncbi:hypothetical protein PMKS-001818 [Pichia membranifaciens]|uniref:BAR domain-containing protein n=1 Tax=Pichia membranifaciens TaxID=4926 RepID=A0A1Q2YFL5_9ASCO|nr:hypothetical protein PMKS-001818 [Pichia membranifaciens]
MSLRGVGKALYRTPHQLFGQKTAEDVMYKQWEHDIKTALAGLEYLKLENQKWKKFWISAITNFIQVIDIFRDLHCELEHAHGADGSSSEKPVDKNEEFTSVTIHELEQAGKLASIILERTTRLAEDSSDSFVAKCNEMIHTLKGAEKLITKRSHKKIDYDMKSNKVDSTLKGSIKTDKDKAKLESDQQKLTESEVIYKDLNDKIKLVVPEILANLSEFISKLTYKLYYSNMDILNFIQRNIEKFDRIHGIASDAKFLVYDDIIADFNGLYSQAQSKLGNLSLLKEFRSFRNKNLTEKTVQGVNTVAGTVVDSTVNFTSTIYTKAAKPSQKLSMSLTSIKIDNPIHPYDKHGMFTTALDPFEFIKSADYAAQLSKSDLKCMSPNYDTKDKSYATYSEEQSEDDADTESKTSEESEVSEEKLSVTGTEWMKPLRNSTLNRVSSPLTSSSQAATADGASEKITLNSSLNTSQPSTATDGKYMANSRVQSLSLNSKSETYKYVNVTMDSITKRIYLVVSTPEIDCAPVNVPKSKLNLPDVELRDYFMARSSITANAFAAYSNI